jgi:hypothetical protein
MRFARIVFLVAGIWGVVVLAPLYWLVDLTGHRYAPPADYPQFFYGFLSVALAWQIAFLVIGSNPVRLRLLMVPAIIEKLGFVLTVVVLHGQARISSTDTMVIVPDLLLGILFVIALTKTHAIEQPRSRMGLIPLSKGNNILADQSRDSST